MLCFIQCEGWINEAGQFLLQVGRKATECKSSADANALIDELEKFRTEGANEENQRLTDMEKIAVDLYGESVAYLCGGIQKRNPVSSSGKKKRD